jgi:glucosamine 6-phosphate synthetase-like amidotransferase/phosphosugar isomerase protein
MSPSAPILEHRPYEALGQVAAEEAQKLIGNRGRIALITQSRGEHAFGLAWLNAGGTIQTLKQPGPASRHLDELERCRDAVALIGHCRYATHGAPAENRNNHPHLAGAGVIVHNGVVLNHQDLVRRYGLRPRTECDSEVLGLLMARCPGALAQRAAWAANQAEGDLAILGLWNGPVRLLVVRRGRPLHVGQAREGYYLASLAEGLPGKAQPVADGRARVVAFQRGTLRLDGKSARLAGGM